MIKIEGNKWTFKPTCAIMTCMKEYYRLECQGMQVRPVGWCGHIKQE